MNRTGYIGGSDFHEILSGCWLRLWLEKRGEGYQRPETGAMRRGKKLEDLIVEEYVESTGRKVKRANKQITHKDYPWVMGRIDRWTWREKQRGVLECKSAAPHRFRTFEREGLPESYIAQANWYMYVTGAQWACFAVLEPVDWQFRAFDIERDEVLIQLLHEQASSFWALIENGPRPEPLSEYASQCRGCHNWNLCHPLSLIEPHGDAEIDDSITEIAEKYSAANAIHLEAKHYRDECQQTLYEAIGNRAKVRAGEFIVIQSTQKRKAYTVAETEFKTVRVQPAQKG